ncbi:hypothetical protein LJB95_02815 [Paludibacteraceae bacterium OttesenSCG-928-F17]|nr:hypothetical protein [Paludibacteraceae bacterium OttesenSCG-928-F17]
MNKKIVIIILTVVIALLIGVSIYFIQQSRKSTREMNEIVEMMNFEKEQLEREYSDLSIEFNDYPVNIKNDSLVQLLENEKMRVQQLLEELRITKSTNARRIAELKKELATVRGVMISYVAQIDSLNTINTKLEKENKEVRQKYQAASNTVTQLSKEKEKLNETVARASKLDLINISMTTLNSKGRATKRFSQIDNLQFNYTIPKNITAQPGIKNVYLRLTRPDGETMVKNEANTFPFEDKNIYYSSMRDFEYEGEMLSDVIYWKVEEILQKGNYRADFFIDGDLVGTYTFMLD